MSLLVVTVSSIAFVASLVARTIRRERARLRALPPPDDPRWRADTSERQIVGIACVHCRQRFVLQKDAKTCRDCHVLLHAKRCHRQHRVQEHLGKREVPYR